MSSENQKILLDYKSERNLTKHSLNRACVLLFWEINEKSCFALACDNQHQPPLVNYTLTTRQWEIQNSTFRTPVDGVFPDFLSVQNMVRVIEGKII